jgi:hypothetical protein
MRSAEVSPPHTSDIGLSYGRRPPAAVTGVNRFDPGPPLPGLRFPHVPTDGLAERLRARDRVALVDDLAANERQLREDAL